MLRYAVLLGPAVVALSGCGQQAGPSVADVSGLMDPAAAHLNETAPDKYRARFSTSAGTFVVEVTRAWALHGADRFYNLVKNGFFDQQRFFRVMPNFIAQWGMPANPELTPVWQNATIKDDPVKETNRRGTITYAKPGRGRDTRTTQLFINLKDNGSLDKDGFAAFGEVVEGMSAVDAINSEYGERPSQQKIGQRGNEYLKKLFPNLSYIETAQIVE